LSQIAYANPKARPPGLGPLTSPDDDRDAGTKNRSWAIVPLMISLLIHIVFLMQYWIPETSKFPGATWWMTQLGPLASPALVTGGEPISQTQRDYADPGAFLLLVASIVLVCLSRTRRWWGRFAILLPAAVGLLVGLGMLVSLLSTGGNRTSALSVMLLVLWMIAAGYAANQGVQDRLGHPPPKTWRSGIPSLVAYAMVVPAPTAAGRWLFAPELRNVALELQGNTVGFRLSALWTAASAWLYLGGLLVGVTIWVMYRWWPTRPGSQGTTLIIAVAVMLLVTGAAGWTASVLADRRADQLQNDSPAAEASFACAAWVLEQTPPKPVQTITIGGAGCRTVTRLEGYLQRVTRALPVSLSPVTARTPEGGQIAGEVVAAQYGPVMVAAGSDGQLDRAADRLIGFRVTDIEPLWQLNCADALAVRFARVPTGDDPQRGYITRNETAPAVVVACAGTTVSFDPAVGPK
jgi:hypothetical protein